MLFCKLLIIKEVAKMVQKTLKKVDPSLLKVGDLVYVKTLESVVKVVDVKKDKKKVDVLFGDLTLKISKNDLYCVDERIKVVNKPKDKVSFNRKIGVKESNLELNIVGKDTVDGIIEVERFIDEAILMNAEEIKIIHGVGTGRLRVAVMDYLKKNRYVDSFRSGKYGEGEKGVTIVKLK